MNLSLEDMSPFGLELFETDYAARPGRESDGKRHQDRESVAFGWMALAVRYRLWSLFTAEARARLDSKVPA
jgi:hypothetical protein